MKGSSHPEPEDHVASEKGSDRYRVYPNGTIAEQSWLDPGKTGEMRYTVTLDLNHETTREFVCAALNAAFAIRMLPRDSVGNLYGSEEDQNWATENGWVFHARKDSSSPARWSKGDLHAVAAWGDVRDGFLPVRGKWRECVDRADFSMKVPSLRAAMTLAGERL